MYSTVSDLLCGLLNLARSHRMPKASSSYHVRGVLLLYFISDVLLYFSLAWRRSAFMVFRRLAPLPKPYMLDTIEPRGVTRGVTSFFGFFSFTFLRVRVFATVPWLATTRRDPALRHRLAAATWHFGFAAAATRAMAARLAKSRDGGSGAWYSAFS